MRLLLIVNFSPSRYFFTHEFPFCIFTDSLKIIPGNSIGDLNINARASTLTRNFVKKIGTTAYYSDSLTYVLQCLTTNDSIRALRLYKYNNYVFSPYFWTMSDLSIGANISRITSVYSPSLIRVEHVARGIDTVDISVVQSDGIAFVRDNNSINEVYVFSPGDSINFQDFTYEKKFLLKTQASQNGVSWIKVPENFLR